MIPQLVKKNNNNKNIFIEYNVTEKELVKKYNSARLLIVPSRGYESLPTVILEAIACETTVAAQSADNVHINAGVTKAEFVKLRQCRDKDLAAPRLLYPAVQFNIRAGAFPPAEASARDRPMT